MSHISNEIRLHYKNLPSKEYPKHECCKNKERNLEVLGQSLLVAPLVKPLGIEHPAHLQQLQVCLPLFRKLQCLFNMNSPVRGCYV